MNWGYFQRKDFKCKCGKCNYDTVDAELLEILNKLRNHYGKRIFVSSGHRCPDHNADVGGGRKSQHLLGRAADIWVDGVNAHDVYHLLDSWYPFDFGLGKYEDFTHFDTRTKKARW